MKHLLQTACVILGAALSSSAATYTVTNTADSGPGSLRAAVAAANASQSSDHIHFNIPACSEGGCRIVLTSGELGLRSAAESGGLSIANPRNPTTLIISGNNASRIFNVAEGGSVTLAGLTLENGWSGAGGAITNRGSLVITNCVIRNSRAIRQGQEFFGSGGAIWSRLGNLTVESSEISGNLAEMGGGIASDFSNLVIRNSTVSRNTSQNEGGGVWLAIEPPYTGSPQILNSTFSDNSTDVYGGGLFILGHPLVPVILANTTISRNKAGHFGAGVGCAHNGFWYDGLLFVVNSIVAENFAPLFPNDADINRGFITVRSFGNNILGGSPLLLPLADNGGPTRTHALNMGSPAIDAGNNCILIANGCGFEHEALPTDQRGKGRVGTVDIGAFESISPITVHQLTGRVLTPVRQPLRSAPVTLTDSNGDTKQVVTSSLGYFAFHDIPAGNYTVSVGSKRYRFTAQNVDLTDAVQALEFVGVE